MVGLGTSSACTGYTNCKQDALLRAMFAMPNMLAQDHLLWSELSALGKHDS